MCEKENYLIKLAAKQESGEKLNMWDRKIIALQKSEANGHSSVSWVSSKIDEILVQRSEYLKKKFKTV